MKKNLAALFSICLFLVGKAKAQTPSANEVINKAVAEAKATHKNVFLLFHASWCHWCHEMDTLMSRPTVKKAFDDNYVITHITVMEMKDMAKANNPRGKEVLDSLGGANSGIPYWVVINENGELVANARLKTPAESLTSVNGDNIGCPAQVEERNYLLRVLKATSHMTAAELAAVDKVFTPKK